MRVPECQGCVMRILLFLIPALLSSAACSSQADFARRTGIGEDPGTVAGAAARTAARTPGVAARPVSVRQTAESGGGTWEFEYSWPGAVSEEPELARRLGAEKDKALAGEKAEWNEAIADAPPDCISCRSRSFAKVWQVVANLPGWLSLSAELAGYTGGAHGNYGMQSLVWDKVRKVAMDGAGLFQSPAALQQAMGAALCDALNRERVRKGVEPPAGPDAVFPACPGLEEATILVGSGNRKTFDRITVYFGPYVAGSYAEGAYELDFPVTAAMLAAVKPEYRSAFAVR